MDSMVGLTLGNFQIIELIGRGGMSSVYLAADKELERSVALKIPHPRFIDDSDFVKRFRREAKAMARLRQPNIVQIYSVGSHGGMPFFAMEYVHGESLSRVIDREGSLDTDHALKCIRQIARAVEYAHNMDVVHRDIKPANILVEPSGRVLVTDFGISKLLSDQTTEETLGLVGTPQYMSPEQCGEGVLDHRSDIYSLGAVFFEMLTGKPPFSGGSPAETIKKQLFDTPEFPHEFKKKVPERIQAIVSKMLAKDPEQRYADIPAFLGEIESFDKENAGLAAADSSAEQTRGNGAQNTQDFISHVNGHRTPWPALVLASLVAVCAIAFSASLVVSNGVDLHIEATGNPVSKGENPASSGVEQGPPAKVEIGKRHVDAKEARPAGSPVSVSEMANAVADEAEAAQEPKRVKVQINSKPDGAEVFLDSKPRGKTPLVLPEVARGKHVLAMKLEGYPDYSGEISADTSNPAEVFHDFAAAKEALIPKGSLSIDSKPSGAAVYLDGKSKGRTPLEVSELRSGSYTVALKLDGYKNTSKEIAIEPDKKLAISLNLVEKPKFGALSIHSQPDGAEVLLNGIYKGTTPLRMKQVKVGEYEVVLRKDGYEPVKHKLVCAKDKTTPFQAAMRMTPKFAALQSVIAGDNHMETGNFAGAVTAYESALSLDPEVPTYLEKLRHAGESLLVKQVRVVLASFKSAYENENEELFVFLLDEGAPDFFEKQSSNAERLFREFDDISVAFSDINIIARNSDEAQVKLHLNIRASFAETGHSMVLLNKDQAITVRQIAEDDWKICAME